MKTASPQVLSNSMLPPRSSFLSVRFLSVILWVICNTAPQAIAGPADSAFPSPSDQVVTLPPQPAVYKIDGAAWLAQGTASTWLRLRSGPGANGRRDHLVFATDDSRIVLVVDTFSSSSWPREVVRIGARAGGNLRDNRRNFPEASILIDNEQSLPARPDIPYVGIRPFPEDQWHFVAMTWHGYPAGQVAIYPDGEKVAVRNYDGTTDGQDSPARAIAVAARPRHWQGEIRGLPDGTTVELLPKGAMALSDGGIDMRELHLIARAMDEADIRRLMAATRVEP